MMRAFHNDPKIKAKYVKRVLAHQKANRIIQGTGWDGEKGCGIGCTLENYDHAQYPIELGIPEWLAQVEDRIFEGLPHTQACFWPACFLKAINVGANLETIKAPFIVFLLEEARLSFDREIFPEADTAICQIIELWKHAPVQEYEAVWMGAKKVMELVRPQMPEMLCVVRAAIQVVLAGFKFENAQEKSQAIAAEMLSLVRAMPANAYVNYSDKLIELLRACK